MPQTSFFSRHPRLPPSHCPSPHSFSSAFDYIQRISSLPYQLQFCSVWWGRKWEDLPTALPFPSGSRAVRVWSSPRSGSLLLVPLCARAACVRACAEWAASDHVWFGATLRAEERMVSGPYFICLDFIWFICFLVLIWFVFIWFTCFRNSCLFSISSESLLCFIIWVPYLLNF